MQYTQFDLVINWPIWINLYWGIFPKSLNIYGNYLKLNRTICIDDTVSRWKMVNDDRNVCFLVKTVEFIILASQKDHVYDGLI